MSIQRSVGALVLVTVTVTFAATASRTAVAQPRDCNRPMAQPITDVPVQGLALHPTVTKDGCWLFTGFIERKEGPASGIAVSRRNGDTFEEVRTLPLPLSRGRADGLVAMGMAVTQDQKLLVVSHDRRLTVFDVERLLSGDRSLLGELEGLRMTESWGLALTADDRYAFAAQRATAVTAMVDLQQARNSGADLNTVTAFIPMSRFPVNPVVSGDGRYLYIANRGAPDVLEVPRSCREDKKQADVIQRDGVIQIVDVQRAVVDPASATVGWIAPAGCAPQNLTLSPDGTRLSATSRGLESSGPTADDNAVFFFDTGPLDRGEMPKQTARIPMPGRPLMIKDTGERIIVGFFDQPNMPDSSVDLLVIDPAKIPSGKDAVVGTLPFPALYLSLSPDRQTLFASRPGTLSVVDLQRVKLDPVQQ